MGRLMPEYCQHDVLIDWGDFGPCQGFCDEVHPDDLRNCPDNPPFDCPECAAGDAPWFSFYTRVATAVLKHFGHQVPEITVTDAHTIKDATLAAQEAE